MFNFNLYKCPFYKCYPNQTYLTVLLTKVIFVRVGHYHSSLKALLLPSQDYKSLTLNSLSTNKMKLYLFNKIFEHLQKFTKKYHYT